MFVKAADLKDGWLVAGEKDVAGSAVQTFLFSCTARVLVLTVLADIVGGTSKYKHSVVVIYQNIQSK